MDEARKEAFEDRRKNEKNENKNKQALIADPAKTHGPITEIYVL